jgi:hypothetical protein
MHRVLARREVSSRGRRSWRVSAAATMLAAVCVACGGQNEPSTPHSSDDGAASGARAAPFVMFTQASVVVDRLDVPQPPPVAVGSTVSSRTVVSDDPSIVRVNEAGELVGVRNGRTTVRAAGDASASIEVEVRAAGSFQIDPPVLRLRPGERRVFALVDDDRRALPAAAVTAATWTTSAPDVAIVVGGEAETRERLGASMVTATYAGRSARAQVLVEDAAPVAFRVMPSKPRVRVGQPITFEAASARGPVQVHWAAAASDVVEQVGAATFVAVRAGKANVCGDAHGRSACTVVTVR